MANPTLHSAIGMGIVSIVPVPFLSLPLAFISHFLLDYFPEHIGKPTGWMMLIETILCLGIIYTLVTLGSWMFVLGAIAANLPDMLEGIYYLFKKKWFAYPKWFPTQTCSMEAVPNSIIDFVIVMTIMGLLINR
jgi:hypothetical protein